MRQHIIQLARRRGEGQHPGLILTRYLAEQNDEGRDKRALFRAACEASRDQSLIALYRRAYDRWCQSLTGVKEKEFVQTPPCMRLIVGLGNKGVIEAGLRLHHTYGVPLVPGSALKGLASHYCAEVWGKTDPKYALPPDGFDPDKDTNYHRLLFGATDDGGIIRFEDAWMHPDSLRDQGLLADVMTPHHQHWQTDENVAPTDFDSPIPVPFLSVAGRFHVAVCWQGPPEHAEAKKWTKRAMELLKAALNDWGAGGKTSSGYGRLIDPLEVPVTHPGSTTGPQQTATTSPSSGTPILQALSVGQKVKVKFLAPHPSGGKNCFRVQEEGKPGGILQAGKPPEKFPAVGEEIQVYRDNTDLRSPRYRWDALPPPQQPALRKKPRR